jgi:2-polyprenyl-6-hydroxyphenyl methylase/3-demethylubiquinone-9 3-methyltransferase
MPSVAEYYRDCYQDQLQGAPGPEAEATFRRRVEAALRTVGTPPRRVLDFGCGTGAATRALAEAGHQVVGVDVSASGLVLSRRNVPGAGFALIGSEARIPFGDGAFDACFCTEVIEHLLDVQGFLGEVHRVLRRRGVLLLTTPYHGWLKNLVIITRGFDRHFDVRGGHIRFFTPASLSDCLRAAGFEAVQVDGTGRPWPVWKSMIVRARRRD